MWSFLTNCIRAVKNVYEQLDYITEGFSTFFIVLRHKELMLKKVNKLYESSVNIL
jgi:hypothetical protein